MDQRNSLLSPTFASAAAAAGLQSQFAAAGLSNTNSNMNNPLLMSTLQQLGLSTNPSNFLQQSQLSSFGNTLTTDLASVAWNNQPTAQTWLDQAKMAAMLPVYNSMLQSSVNDQAQNRLGTMMEQSFKAAAAAAAVGAASQDSLPNLVNSQVNHITNPIMATLAAAAANPLPQLHTTPQSFLSNSVTQQNNMGIIPDNSLPQQQSFSKFNLNTSSMPGNLGALNLSIPCSVMQNIPTTLVSESYSVPKPQPIALHPGDGFGGVGISTANTTTEPSLNSAFKTFTSNTKNGNHQHLSQLLSNMAPPSSSSVSKVHHSLPPQPLVSPPTTSAVLPQALSSGMPKPESSTSLKTTTTSFNNGAPKPRGHRDDNDKDLIGFLRMAVDGTLPPEESSPHGSPLSHFHEGEQDHLDLFNVDTTGFSLDPIMFTPPESPKSFKPATKDTPGPSHVSEITDSAPNTSMSSPSKSKPPARGVSVFDDIDDPVKDSTSDLFMPIRKSHIDNSRVPVYKRQNIHTPVALTLEKALDRVAKSKISDEYSFTDDEEEEPPKKEIASPIKVEIFEEPAKKIRRVTSPTVSVSASVRSPEGSVKRKPLAAINDLTPEEKGIPQRINNNLAAIIKARRETSDQLPNVFVVTTIVDNGDDSAFTQPVSLPSEDQKPVKEESQSTETLPTISDVKSDAGDFRKPSTASISPPPRLVKFKDTPETPVPVSELPATTSTESDKPPDMPSTSEEPRVLPKIILKLPRISIDLKEHRKEEKHHKKKKKHKKKHRDEDWEPSDKQKKKKKHKHKHEKKHDVNDKDSRKPTTSSAAARKPKARKIPTSNVARLAAFSLANGDVSKGTFVVAKQDVFKEDCPLWKVDNQNLLQKYPQFVEVLDKNKKRICYKNSSTYAGWCDQVASEYYVIRVKYHKHTRAETVVEPEFPLHELIPAVSYVSSCIESMSLEEMNGNDTTDNGGSSASKDMIRGYVKTIVHAMLKHAASMTFLQTVKTCNDWDFMCALNELDRISDSTKQKINNRVKWKQRFEFLITVYWNILVSECKHGDYVCYACGERRVSHKLSLFSDRTYNYDTLDAESLPTIDGKTPLVACEFVVCHMCKNLAYLYHRLHHMRYTIFVFCENLIESLSVAKPGLPVDGIIGLCLEHKSVQKKIINKYSTLWKKIQENDF